jgi:hypothetical protein
LDEPGFSKTPPEFSEQGLEFGLFSRVIIAYPKIQDEISVWRRRRALRRGSARRRFAAVGPGDVAEKLFHF